MAAKSQGSRAAVRGATLQPAPVGGPPPGSRLRSVLGWLARGKLAGTDDLDTVLAAHLQSAPACCSLLLFEVANRKLTGTDDLDSVDTVWAATWQSAPASCCGGCYNK